jgi:hypothetical protein
MKNTIFAVLATFCAASAWAQTPAAPGASKTSSFGATMDPSAKEANAARKARLRADVHAANERLYGGKARVDLKKTAPVHGQQAVPAQGVGAKALPGQMVRPGEPKAFIVGGGAKGQ